MSINGLIEEGEAFSRLHEGPATTRVDVLVIGGGQAGLSAGYYLKQLGVSFVIVDANARIGDAWRKRWDSLRLFTPARYDGLDGMPFPAAADYFPTKDEMADYLERYAAHFQLPVRTSVKVQRLWREGDRYFADAEGMRFEATHVVVALSSYQGAKVPAFAADLSRDIVQLHSSAYKSLAQLQPGPVLIVGTANSGAELATETVTAHPTFIAGRDVGEIPFRITNPFAHRVVMPLLFRVLFHRILTIKTPIGRKAQKDRHMALNRIRQKRADLERAGVQWTERVVGVTGGRPRLADGRTLDVRNVIWCTGYDSGLSFVDLPVFDSDGEPRHAGGVVQGEPGLYFVGQQFQYAVSSTMIHGVGRDAARMVQTIRSRRALAQGSAA